MSREPCSGAFRREGRATPCLPTNFRRAGSTVLRHTMGAGHSRRSNVNMPCQPCRVTLDCACCVNCVVSCLFARAVSTMPCRVATIRACHVNRSLSCRAARAVPTMCFVQPCRPCQFMQTEYSFFRHHVNFCEPCNPCRVSRSNFCKSGSPCCRDFQLRANNPCQFRHAVNYFF